MKINLPFCPPFEIVGHRPNTPIINPETQADIATLWRYLPLKLRRVQRPAWANGAVMPPLGVESAAPDPAQQPRTETLAAQGLPAPAEQQQRALAQRLQTLQTWLDDAPPGEQAERRHVASEFRACLIDPASSDLQLLNLFDVTSLPPIPPAVKKLSLWNCPNLRPAPDLSACTQLTNFFMVRCPNIAMPSLSHLKQLTSLNFARSPNVTEVDVSNCDQLTTLLLPQCSNLWSLNISGCTRLAWLNLAMCASLTPLPSFGQFQQLRDLDLSGIPMTSVPDDILYLHRECMVHLDAGNLSDAVRNRLLSVVNAPGYAGPQIQYSMVAPGTITAILPIDRAVAEWRSEAATQQPAASSGFDWSALPVQDNVTAFATFLARVRESGDYRDAKPELKAATQQRVTALLAQLETDPTLREDCFNLALDAVNTCGDRVALRLMDMEQMAIHCDARAAIDTGKFDIDPRPLIDLCKGQYRLAIIAAAAENKAATMNFTDPIEVHLGYLTKLAAPCKLPVRITTMLYPACAGVTNEDLANISKKLMSTGASPEECEDNNRAYQKFLAASGLIRQLLTRLRPADMGAVNAFNDELIEHAQNSIRARLDALQPTAADYRACSKELMTQFHVASIDIPALATLPLLQDFLAVHAIETTLHDA